MALYRAITVGRFKCSCAAPKITVGEFLGEGYVLTIKKNSANKFCLNCIRYFFSKGKLKITEDENYLTIRSPLRNEGVVRLENFE
jgi:hypothetical protein